MGQQRMSVSSPRDALYLAHVERLQTNVAAILTAHELDGLLIHSGAPHRRTRWDDQDDPFRVQPWFAWWLPLEQSDCWLLVRRDERPMLLWPQSDSFWDSEPEAETFWQAHFERVRCPLPQLASQLGARLPKRCAVLAEDAGALARIGREDLPLAAQPLVEDLEDLRVIKDDFEVACLTEATRKAAEGHEAIVSRLASGADVSELSLLADYLLASGQEGAETPYRTIVALDANAATLHHVVYNRSPRQPGLVLVDGGASVYGYGSDITRTWLAPTAHALMQAVVAGVDRVQLQLCEGIQPGRPYEDLHDEAHVRLGGLLQELGIVRPGANGSLPKAVTAAFFPHGIGHSLGIQTHDVGCRRQPPRADNPFLRNTRTMQAGQVFTVEPGLYLIDALLQPLQQGPHAGLVDWNAVDVLRPYGGVRIEDNLVVRPDGHDNLTRPLLPRGGGVA